MDVVQIKCLLGLDVYDLKVFKVHIHGSFSTSCNDRAGHWPIAA